MAVKRAVESRSKTREGFCKLLANIAADPNGLYKNEYSDELSRYLEDVKLNDVEKTYGVKTAVSRVKNVRYMVLEVPDEYRYKGMDNTRVVLQIGSDDDKLKFNVRNPK
jgi:hypothetical protein